MATKRILGGRYTVQDKIGTGGMAIVYRGLDEVLGRTVAIKTMLPQYANDPSFAARFKQEAQAAAALSSPYIVSVYDWGKDDDTYYIVMEYLRGTDLKSGIRKHGALDCRKVAQIGSQISQALSVAHKHDIIHRDIKPQNIMVQPDGNIKVMDFGIARAKNSHLTQDNNVLGTAHYVSPEQTQGKELGATSDIYSLGVVMYEAATGEVPFKGDDAISVALKQVNEQPIPPSQKNPAVDPQLEAIILKCMQKDPAARFQTADELSRTLRDYLAGRMSQVNRATEMIATSSHAAQPITPNQATQTLQRTTSAPLDARTAVRPASDQRHGGAATTVYDTYEEPRSGGGIGRFFLTLFILGILAAAAWWGVNYYLNHRATSQDVPNFIGYTQETAVAQIEASEWFEIGTVTEEYNSAFEAGVVVDQSPDPGRPVVKGTQINLVVSKGVEPAKDTTVPDLKDKTPAEAERLLEEAGLRGQAGESIYSDTVENGRVAGQSKPAGSTAREGEIITYQISLGTQQVEVPEIVGFWESSAVSALEEAGFVVSYNNSQYSNYYSAGQVVSVYPTGLQPKGSTITITLSLGPQPQVVTPEPTTPTQEDPSSTSTGDTTQEDPQETDTGSGEETSG